MIRLTIRLRYILLYIYEKIKKIKIELFFLENKFCKGG